MFENFSFSSPSSNGPLSPPLDEGLAPCSLFDNHSNRVSPFSSRCSSPFTGGATYPLPKSHRISPTPNGSALHRLSIGALPPKFNSQSMHQREGMLPPTPPYSPCEDEGYVGAYSPEELSPASSDCPSTYLDMLAPPPTSSPAGCITLSRRYQRQFLSRLQCSTSDVLSLAMLAEECHPSSLPLPPMAESSGGGSASRRPSVSSIAGGGPATRIQKGAGVRRMSSISLAGLSLEDSPRSKTGSRKNSVVVHRSPKMRDRTGAASGAGKR